MNTNNNNSTNNNSYNNNNNNNKIRSPITCHFLKINRQMNIQIKQEK